MRSLLGYLSVCAAVAIACGALLVGSVSYCGTGVLSAGAAGGGFDLRALLIGLAGGAVVANVSRLRWVDVPRHAMAWIKANEHNMHRVGWVAVLLGVLFFY